LVSKNAEKAAAAVAIAVGSVGGVFLIARAVASVGGVPPKNAGILSVDISPASVTLNIGQPQTFQASVSGGTAPYSYQWFLNGNVIQTGASSSYTFTPDTGGSDAVYVVVTDGSGAQGASVDAIITVSGPGGISPGPSGIPVAIHATNYQTSLAQLYAFWVQGLNLLTGKLHVDSVINFQTSGHAPVNLGSISVLAQFKVVDASGNGVPGVSVQISSNMSSDDQGGELLIDGVSVSAAQPKTTDENGNVYWYLSYRMNDFSGLCKLHGMCCAMWVLLGAINLGGICVGGECTNPAFVDYWKTKGPVYTQNRVYTITATMVGTTLQASFAMACQAESEAVW
jgi:hypothetical protein